MPTVERDKARKAIYENKVPFVEWVKDAGGAVDIGTSVRRNGAG